jgi:hypothetical protein
MEVMLFLIKERPHTVFELSLKKIGAIVFSSVFLACLLGLSLPWSLTVQQVIWLQGIIAAFISFYLFHLPIWQVLIYWFFLPVLLLAVVTLNLSAYWYLSGFMVLVLIFGGIHRTRVPLFLSSRKAVNTLAELLPKNRDFKLIDLGSGCGGLICRLAQMLPRGMYYGVEAAMLPCWISKLRGMLSGQHCQFRWESIWQQDLSEYDVVYAYLSPVPMQRLWEKAHQEMQSGSLFISNTFTVPDIVPDQCIQLDDFSGAVLYIWRIN